MSQLQALDMSEAPVNVVHMSKMIQIRNVPDEMHRSLKIRAAAAGMNLSDYIKRELSWATGKDSWEEIDARAKARGPSRSAPRRVVDIIREHRGD